METDPVYERLLRNMELSDFECVVDRVAGAIFRRAMEERQTFAAPALAHRYDPDRYPDMPEEMQRGWKDIARAALAGREPDYAEVEHE